MLIDSEHFNIETISSEKVGSGITSELADRLAPFLGELIENLPDNDPEIETRLRAVIDILVISKLQAKSDRSELNRAKSLVITQQESIADAMPKVFGSVVAFPLEHWVVLIPRAESDTPAQQICGDIESAVEHFGFFKHYIMDFGWTKKMATQMVGYCLGLKSMIERFRGRLSVLWLPFSSISPTTQATLISRFNFLKKGAFLISRSSGNWALAHDG